LQKKKYYLKKLFKSVKKMYLLSFGFYDKFKHFLINQFFK